MEEYSYGKYKEINDRLQFLTTVESLTESEKSTFDWTLTSRSEEQLTYMASLVIRFIHEEINFEKAANIILGKNLIDRDYLTPIIKEMWDVMALLKKLYPHTHEDYGTLIDAPARYYNVTQLLGRLSWLHLKSGRQPYIDKDQIAYLVEYFYNCCEDEPLVMEVFSEED